MWHDKSIAYWASGKSVFGLYMGNNNGSFLAESRKSNSVVYLIAAAVRCVKDAN